MLDKMDFHHFGTSTSEVDSFNINKHEQVRKVKIYQLEALESSRLTF
jgi:hypothetical protein